MAVFSQNYLLLMQKQDSTVFAEANVTSASNMIPLIDILLTCATH